MDGDAETPVDEEALDNRPIDEAGIRPTERTSFIPEEGPHATADGLRVALRGAV